MQGAIHLGISLDSQSIHTYTSDAAGHERLRAREPLSSNSASLLDTLKRLVNKSRIQFGELKALTLSCSEYFTASNSLHQPSPEQLVNALSQTFTIECQLVSHSQAAAMHVSAHHQRLLSVSLGDSCGLALFENGRLRPNRLCETWAHSELPGFDWLVDGLTPVCRCSSEHCIEQFLSVGGIERQYHQIVLQDKPLAVIFAGVANAVPTDTRVYRTFIDQLARSLAKPITELMPETLLLSGDVVCHGRINDDLLVALSRYIDVSLLPDSITLSSDAFAFDQGAALFSEKNHNNRFLSAR